MSDNKEPKVTTSSVNYNTHTILQPRDCNCGESRNYPCPVCDGGLSFCTVCKGGEAELEEQSCEERIRGKLKEPKVTECYSIPKDDLHPSAHVDYIKWTSRADAAILLWRDDYDAMRSELEELRKRCRYNLEPGAQVTCWDEYERVRKELEELRVSRDAWKNNAVEYNERADYWKRMALISKR